ncbi:hypothetical protein LCGC14_1176980 [marine sediment metagenome]|uniref:Uncharacterized protein n=1 Tax=marine sediment metagenome TaxID=412755 RepID=A0A0F9PTM2_9ZZZZ
MTPVKNGTEKKGIWSDIDDNSVKEMLKVGRIYPNIKPRLNAVYEVQVLSQPNEFDSKAYGTAYSLVVLHDGMKKSIVLAKSFRIQLKVEMIRAKLVNNENEPDFKKLIGKILTFQKTLGDTKTMTKVPLYSVQID